MPRAAITLEEIEYLKARQRELTEKMFEPRFSARLKDGTVISGRCISRSNKNNAITATNSGDWEFYSETTIQDQSGKLHILDLMDVETFF
jgi:hypothetical protein